MNTTESPAIEVEVLEIDGSTPQANYSPDSEPVAAPWMQWQGRIRHLDRRWWPLWILLGGVALAVALTLGLLVVVTVVILRILRGIFRSVRRIFRVG